MKGGAKYLYPRHSKQGTQKMNTARMATLEGFMAQWIDAESDEGFPHLISEDLHVQMAKAAAAVFDASMSGQEFLKDN